MHVLQVDYSNSARPGYLVNKVAELKELEISILVNNVGVDVLDHFDNLSEEQMTNLININCTAMTLLNKIFIPRFQQRFREKNLRSAIVNVASLAGIYYKIKDKFR